MSQSEYFYIARLPNWVKFGGGKICQVESGSGIVNLESTVQQKQRYRIMVKSRQYDSDDAENEVMWIGKGKKTNRRAKTVDYE